MATQSPITRKVGRPKLEPLSPGTGKAPTRERRWFDAGLSSEARREALNRWVVQSTREPNKRDFTRAVLQMLADHVDLDPASPTYLQCEGPKQQEIADSIGVSRRCVVGVLQRLREGDIIVVQQVSITITQYTLCPPALANVLGVAHSEVFIQSLHKRLDGFRDSQHRVEKNLIREMQMGMQGIHESLCERLDAQDSRIKNLYWTILWILILTVLLDALLEFLR